MLARLIGEVAALSKQVAALDARVERGSTVQIRADLDNLVGRVEALATSNRKEFGRLHAAQRREPPVANGVTVDDELAATLELQKWSAS